MVNIHPAQCLLCRGSEYETVFTYTEPDAYEAAAGIGSADYHRAWVQCRACGFYYSQYARPADALDNLYETQYRSTHSQWRRRWDGFR